MTDQTPGIRILSVEDDEFFSLFLTDVMWIFGTADHIELLQATNTEKAMQLVINEETRPKLILLDLGLPEKEGGKPEAENGLHFLELVKTDPALLDIKILVFSGSNEPAYREKSVRLGAEKFLVKGEYLPRELIEEVRKALHLTAPLSPTPPA